jgi:hypothetical protein
MSTIKIKFTEFAYQNCCIINPADNDRLDVRQQKMHV